MDKVDANCSGAQIAVDVGGTFTDIVCVVKGVIIRSIKVPTTAGDPSLSILTFIERMGQEWGIDPARITTFSHGTTIATNTIIERKADTIGLITTAGFRDILEIGRQFRSTMYASVMDTGTPTFLSPRYRRKEVRERTLHDGSILVPLDEDEVIYTADELVSDGVRSIAISFLFSCFNPDNEILAKWIIQSKYPKIEISISSEVDPNFREYERTVVTAFDAYIKPVVAKYLERLESGLRALGVSAPLRIMQSRGGLTSSGIAKQRPVRLFLSGPAAGVVGAQAVGAATNHENLISVDIGGTSCDVAVIAAGKPNIRLEGMIGGFPVRVPMIDVNAVGSGGGSIAWVDDAGSLKVGPHSAGADPGPVAYARSGMEPTVTDASIVLGYLNPTFFAGGAIKLAPELSFEAIEQRIARPLGTSVEEAALGIHQVVNAQMVEAIRLLTVKQGLDPRDFSLLCLGGGGGIHAFPLARDLGVKRVLIPVRPGVLAAAGLMCSPIEHEVSAPFQKLLAEALSDEIWSHLETLDQKCLSFFDPDDTPALLKAHYADMCYAGQSFTLEVELGSEKVDLEDIEQRFLNRHATVHGHSPQRPVQFVNLRAVLRLDPSFSNFSYVPIAAGSVRLGISTRKVVIGANQSAEFRVLVRDELKSGDTIQGPAIIEQTDTTTVVPQEWSGYVEVDGTLIFDRNDTLRPL